MSLKKTYVQKVNLRGWIMKHLLVAINWRPVNLVETGLMIWLMFASCVVSTFREVIFFFRVSISKEVFFLLLVIIAYLITSFCRFPRRVNCILIKLYTWILFFKILFREGELWVALFKYACKHSECFLAFKWVKNVV